MDAAQGSGVELVTLKSLLSCVFVRNRLRKSVDGNITLSKSATLVSTLIAGPGFHFKSILLGNNELQAFRYIRGLISEGLRKKNAI